MVFENLHFSVIVFIKIIIIEPKKKQKNTLPTVPCNGYTTEDTTKGGLTSVTQAGRKSHAGSQCSMIREQAAPTPHNVVLCRGENEEVALEIIIFRLPFSN